MRGVCIAEEARAQSAQSGRSDGDPKPPLCPLHECGCLRPPGAAHADGSRRIRRVENSNRMCRRSRHAACMTSRGMCAASSGPEPLTCWHPCWQRCYIYASQHSGNLRRALVTQLVGERSIDRPAGRSALDSLIGASRFMIVCLFQVYCAAFAPVRYDADRRHEGSCLPIMPLEG